MNVQDLQRYEITEHQYGYGYMSYYDKSMEADPEGEFVKFAEVEAMIASAPAMHEALVVLLEVLDNVTTNDFGYVTLNNDHSADFWAALDAAKLAVGGKP